MVKQLPNKQSDDQVEILDYSERWMRDGISVVKAGDFFLSTEVDMSNAKLLIEKYKQRDIKVTYTHVFVYVTAMVLSRHPELHQLLTPKRRIIPGQVDIGLSVAGSTVVAPVMVIKDAANKSIEEIALEIKQRTPEVRMEQEKMFVSTRKWGRLVPWACLRRLILRRLIKKVEFTRTGSGTFQVSCLSDVDQFVPFLFTTSAILGTGRVRDRIVAVNGKPQVRSTAFISCCADHKAWDGILAARFLNEIKAVIEKGDDF